MTLNLRIQESSRKSFNIDIMVMEMVALPFMRGVSEVIKNSVVEQWEVFDHEHETADTIVQSFQQFRFDKREGI